MTERPLRILHVNTRDAIGGAQVFAWNMFESLRALGYHASLAVGHKLSNASEVMLIPNDSSRGWWARFCLAAENVVNSGIGRVVGRRNMIHRPFLLVGQPRRWLQTQRGYEDFDFPGTWRLLKLIPEPPDILHCHNLHGGYFDLRALPWLSQQVPVVLSLHDAWLLSGHCAHSLDCERWQIGCGHCPNLAIFPPLPRDATAKNWRRKKDIFAKSRLYVSAPSRWLMQKAEQSILASAVVGARVIPHGVELDHFHPGNQREARHVLGLPMNAHILLYTSVVARRNPFRDYDLLEQTVRRLSQVEKRACPLVMVCLGDVGEPRRIGQAEVRFVPYQRDRSVVAQYYQAADIYIHAARAEAWGLTVTEAIACGIPVVATAAGAIPEQVEDGITGFLVPPGDSEAMAACVQQLLTDDELRQRCGTKAAERARRSFDLNRQVQDYLDWYKEILASRDSE